MRRVSLNARQAQDAVATDQIFVALIHITHPLLDSPVRLSTDPTEALDEEQSSYGTRSAWMGSNPATEPFLFIIAEASLPSDIQDVPAGAAIIIENLDASIAKLLRSFTTPAEISLGVVLASSPSVIEAEFRGMQIMSADIDTGEITLTFSREAIGDEMYPSGRATKDRFMGLHR